MTDFIQYGIDAIRLGGLYALLALGIATIFGIMQLINFAHGELIVAGGLILLVTGSLGIVPAFVSVVGVGVCLALTMERIAFRPVRGADPATLLVTSFAVSYLLQNLAIIVMGSRPRGIKLPALFTKSVDIGPVVIPVLSIITIVTTVVLIAALVAFFKRTAVGTQMRAAAEDFEIAQIMGVRANGVVAIAFGISGLLAGVVSLLYFAERGTVSPTAGLDPVVIGFVATVLGGLGSLTGPALGGFLLGCVTVALQATLPAALAPYRQSFVFAFVILVLLTRPQGLLGDNPSERRVG